MVRVLYVEDEVINSLVMKKFLDKEFEIIIANSADACRKVLSELLPDVILMDINLGTSSSDGIELFKEIRDNPVTSHTPVMAVTAFAMPNDRDFYMGIGFTDYFSKPINRTEMIERIRTLTSS